MVVVPIPSFLDFLKIFLHTSNSQNLRHMYCGSNEDVIGRLSRSSWSLALIAIWRMRIFSRNRINIWVPDFFCNSALTQLRKLGINIIFYPITDELIPNIGACKMIAKTHAPDVFIVVHYFGRPMPISTAKDFCANHGAWLVEDATHIIRRVDGVGGLGDFTIYSPHKHFAIPDGSILVVQPGGVSKLTDEDLKKIGCEKKWPDQLNNIFNYYRIKNVNSNIASLIWIIKRSLQKIGIKYNHGAGNIFVTSEEENRLAIKMSLISPKQSWLGYKLLAVQVKHINSYIQRRINIKNIWDYLLSKYGQGHIKNVDHIQEKYCIYLAQYRSTVNNLIQTSKFLFERKIPASTWPDLAPEISLNKELYAVAWNRRHQYIYLPTTHSIKTSEITSLFNEDYSDDLLSSFNLNLINCTKEEWKRLISESPNSNMLQDWSYGEAKEINGGWKSLHAVFKINNVTIGYVQILKKKYLNILTVYRINRGPIFKQKVGLEELAKVFSIISSLGNIRHGNILYIAPNLELSGENLVLLERLRFIKMNAPSYRSSLINLENDISLIKKNLNSKWRNLLTASEKYFTECHISNGDDEFMWLMNRYKELKLKNNFTGIPVDFIHTLRLQSGREAMPIITASYDKQPISSVALFISGHIGTYLIGWNSEIGRSKRANYYLIWQAIIHLKSLGIKYLDLGGLDEEMTPGISKFKLGMNGATYSLVGEYVKWL